MGDSLWPTVTRSANAGEVVGGFRLQDHIQREEITEIRAEDLIGGCEHPGAFEARRKTRMKWARKRAR
jgi:hypothetical protein